MHKPPAWRRYAQHFIVGLALYLFYSLTLSIALRIDPRLGNVAIILTALLVLGYTYYASMHYGRKK